MTGMKLTNYYSRAVGDDVYAKASKAVFAAVAVSKLSCGGDRLEFARELFLAEWQCLFDNGIVQQCPPKTFDAENALRREFKGDFYDD
jgi:hypothetical protein